MTAEGLCTANTGDVEYFAQEGTSTDASIPHPDWPGENFQGDTGTCDGGIPGGGPEDNMGGAQINNEPFTSDGSYHAC